MALQSTILKAVATAKIAVQDLAVPATLIHRGEAVHVPGRTPTYPETTNSVKIVITAFKASEIDGDRIRARDVQGLVFPETAVAVPEPNDLITVEGTAYRVIFNSKLYAGDQVVLSQLHLRLQ